MKAGEYKTVLFVRSVQFSDPIFVWKAAPRKGADRTRARMHICVVFAKAKESNFEALIVIWDTYYVPNEWTLFIISQL